MKSQELITLASPADQLAPIVGLVLKSGISEKTKLAYGRALKDFIGWWSAQPDRPPFDRECVLRYREHLTDVLKLGPANINQRLSAIRRLAREAAYKKLLDSAAAQGIRDVKGESQKGVRTGNWLVKADAEATLQKPAGATLKGKRDRAILAVLIGCGLRRDEAARLTVEHIGQRDGRWCIVDLIGKGKKTRTVPMPPWAKVALDHWTAAAGITSGRIFRGVNRGDNLSLGKGCDGLSAQGIFRCVEKYNAETVKFAPHDLRRTYAKLAHKGGSKLDQIQLSLGHASIRTTEIYLGVEQDLTDAPADHLGIHVKF